MTEGKDIPAQTILDSANVGPKRFEALPEEKADNSMVEARIRRSQEIEHLTHSTAAKQDPWVERYNQSVAAGYSEKGKLKPRSKLRPAA